MFRNQLPDYYQAENDIPARAEFNCSTTGKSLVLRDQSLKDFLSEPDKSKISNVFFELMAQNTKIAPVWEAEFLAVRVRNVKYYATIFMGYKIFVADLSGIQLVHNDDYQFLTIISYEEVSGGTDDDDPNNSGPGNGGSGGARLSAICPGAIQPDVLRIGGKKVVGTFMGRSGLDNKKNLLPSSLKRSIPVLDKRNNYVASNNLTLKIVRVARALLLFDRTALHGLNVRNSSSRDQRLELRLVSRHSTLWDLRAISGLKPNNVLEYNEAEFNEVSRNLIRIYKKNAEQLDGLFVKISWEFTSRGKLYCEFSIADHIDGLDRAPRRLIFKDIKFITHAFDPCLSSRQLGTAKLVLTLNLLNADSEYISLSRHHQAGFLDFD